jgi:hypothetical protein
VAGAAGSAEAQVSGSNLYALAPDKSGVFHLKSANGDQSVWEWVGDAAGQLYGGEGTLLRTHPATGDVYKYLNKPGEWQRIGGPGRTFAFGPAIFGLSPDGSGVYEYDAQNNVWTKVGGQAKWIYGGQAGLFATDPGTGNINVYLGGGKWDTAGTAGAHFTVGKRLYGLAPDHSAVNRWEGCQAWTTVGPQPAGWIWARGTTLLATNPTTGNVYLYNGSSWSQVGTPGADFAPDAFGNIYALAPDKGAVFRYEGTSGWSRIGTPAAQIVCT